MQINSISIKNYNQQKSSNSLKRPAFGSFLHQDKAAKLVLDSGFFRANDILLAVIKKLETAFPRGAEIFDFASSNGEEAISIFAQLSNKLKYKIRGFDVSQEAITQARNGVHTVFSGAMDSFLLEQGLPAKQKQLKKCFTSVMERIEKPNEIINNSTTYSAKVENNADFTEAYFKLRDKYKGAISFDYGNINELEKIETGKPVGAILFRNAFYHLCNNNITEVFKWRGEVKHTIDVREVARSLVQKIGDKLNKGGVFALGEHPKDNIFLANNFIPANKTVKYEDTEFFIPAFSHKRDVLFMRKSPIVEAFEQDGRFEPVHYSDIEFLGGVRRCPTVWQKVK